jgi:hypothetical protein
MIETLEVNNPSGSLRNDWCNSMKNEKPRINSGLDQSLQLHSYFYFGTTTGAGKRAALAASAAAEY